MCNKRFELFTQDLGFKGVHFKQRFFRVSWDGDIILETPRKQPLAPSSFSPIIPLCLRSTWTMPLICFNFWSGLQQSDS